MWSGGLRSAPVRNSRVLQLAYTRVGVAGVVHLSELTDRADKGTLV